MSEQTKMMHIGICKGEVGRYVFLPGSPERSEKIAKYFENGVEIAYNREFRTFTGTLEGVAVSVTSTGIGGPSTAIAIEELFQCGSDTMIRVGTCASVSSKVHRGDIVIPNGAVKMEGACLHYLPLEFPAVPDFFILKELVKASKALHYPYNVGITITKASFYTQNEPELKPVGPHLIAKWNSYVAGGATSTEMESSTLFTVGSSLHIRVGTVLVSATDDKNYGSDYASYPGDVEHRAIETAIEAMKNIIRHDRAKENE